MRVWKSCDGVSFGALQQSEFSLGSARGLPSQSDFRDDVRQTFCDLPVWIVGLNFAQVGVVADVISDPVFFNIAPEHFSAGD